jgi:hypothetical protein
MKLRFLRNEVREMRDIDRAVELLKPLFNGLAEDGNKTVDIYADVYNGESYVVVIINKAKYKINVTAESVRQIVWSVINSVALKF